MKYSSALLWKRGISQLFVGDTSYRQPRHAALRCTHTEGRTDSVLERFDSELPFEAASSAQSKVAGR